MKKGVTCFCKEVNFGVGVEYDVLKVELSHVGKFTETISEKILVTKLSIKSITNVQCFKSEG